jgi:hypothetical protein
MTTTSQALDYLETTIDIPSREMSKAMYKLLNTCARIVQREYPGMSGYYDPEFEGKRIDLQKHLHWMFRGKSSAKPIAADPFADSFNLFGIQA